METERKQRMIFVVPESTTRIEILEKILTDNQLEESDAEYVGKSKKGEEPRLSILKQAAIAMAWKKVPEEKIIELLANHLQTSPETAKNIVQALKEKLVPYAKITDDETGEIIGDKEAVDKDGYDKKNFKESLLQKVKSRARIEEPEPEEEKPPMPNLKKPTFQNVEENAEDWKTKKQPIVTDQRNIPAPLKPAAPTPGNNPNSNPAPKPPMPPATTPTPPPKPPEQKPVDPYKEMIE